MNDLPWQCVEPETIEQRLTPLLFPPFLSSSLFPSSLPLVVFMSSPVPTPVDLDLGVYERGTFRRPTSSSSSSSPTHQHQHQHQHHTHHSRRGSINANNAAYTTPPITPTRHTLHSILNGGTSQQPSALSQATSVGPMGGGQAHELYAPPRIFNWTHWLAAYIVRPKTEASGYA